MRDAIILSPNAVNMFPSGVCSGVCTGDQWIIINCNEGLAAFLQSSVAKLRGGSLFSALYGVGADTAVDSIRASLPGQTVVLQTKRCHYALIWTYVKLLDNEAGFIVNPGSSNEDGGEDSARYFTMYEIPAEALNENCDLILREREVILDSINDGIWVIDSNGITVYVNKALERLSGLVGKDVIGKHVTAPMLDGNFTSCVTLSALEEKKAVTLFDDYSTGKRCLNTSTPIFDDQGNIWRVVASIRDMSELEALQTQLAEVEMEARLYKDKLERMGQANPSGFIGKGNTMRKCLGELEKAAKVPSVVLILGDTGTGKTLAASMIHQKSPRSQGPFVTVNCAAIPQNLLEAELFGYEKGAFTGASHDGKKGFFELADKGTLFFDEIGELPLSMQAKLLHVLDSYSFHRVGGVKNIKVDVRILAATNRPLDKLVQAGEFRADLYYRLRVLSVNIPSLREHPEDIAIMAVHFLSEACKLHGTNKFFDPKVLDFFVMHTWPGNVRELRATVEFLAAMTEGNVIRLRDLPPHLYSGSAKEGEEQPQSLKVAIESLEYKMIKEALVKTGSTYKAAALLGVSQSTVVRKAHRLNIFVPE